MRKRFYKLFLVGQMEKEEQWLNEMADHGFLVVNVRKFYFDFDEVDPGKYRIKVMMLKGSKNSPKNQDFYRFLEDMGISYVDGMNFPGVCYVYLKMPKDSDVNQLEMYSDVDSKIRYNRMVMFYMIFATIAITLIGIWNFYMAFGRSDNGVSWLNAFIRHRNDHQLPDHRPQTQAGETHP